MEEPPGRGKETSEVKSPPAEDRLLSSELKSITEHDAQAKLGQQLAAFAGGGGPAEAQAEQPSLLEPLWRWLGRLNENDRSWYMFSPGNLFRKVVQAVTDAPIFGKVVLTVVFANCIVMAMQPGVCDPACERGSYARTLAVMDTVFTILFTVEIALQTIAKNFILGPGAYLHDGWNWIDFVSTATGYLAFIPIGADGGGITGLRALRALRPLRALKVIPGLKVLVQCLLEILPLLVDVLFLLVWVFIVFGIIALNLFMGSLRTRCVYADLSLPPGMPLPPSSPAPPGAGNGTWGTPASPPTDWLKNATWVDEAKKNATWIVVPDLEDQPCSYGNDNGAFQCPSDYNGLPVSCAKGYPNPNYGYAGYDNFGLASFNIFAVLTLDAWTEEQLYLQWDVLGPGIPIVFFALLVLFGAFFTMQLLVAIMSSKFAQLSAQADTGPSRTATRRLSASTDTDDERSGSSDLLGPRRTPSQRRSMRQQLRWAWGRVRRGVRTVRRRWRALCEAGSTWWYDIKLRYMQPVHRAHLPRWRKWAYTIVHHHWFNQVMLVMIVANTVILGMDHYGINLTWLHVLEIMNTVFTAAFIVEFVLKHIAIGFLRYWADPWNVLDGMVVLVSIAELVIVATGGNKTGTQAFRTMRLLRVLRSLKLLKRVQGLHRLLQLVLRGFYTLRDFLLLLALFVFVFAVLGMQQFAGLWSYTALANPDYPSKARSNFNNMWTSSYTVFQILTCDDWVRITWNGMRGRGTASVLYFMAWAIIGNFILLTLFLAILISSFQTDTQDEPDEDDASEAEGSQAEGGMRSGRSSVGTVESEQRRRNAYRNTGDAPAPGGPGGPQPHGTGRGTNALQQRVAERVSERLDPARVKIMKRWLVMIGVTHGMSGEEVSHIARELDARLSYDPDSINRDSSFTAPLAVLNRHTSHPLMKRGSTLRRSTAAHEVANQELPPTLEEPMEGSGNGREREDGAGAGPGGDDRKTANGPRPFASAAAGAVVDHESDGEGGGGAAAVAAAAAGNAPDVAAVDSGAGEGLPSGAIVTERSSAISLINRLTLAVRKQLGGQKSGGNSPRTSQPGSAPLAAGNSAPVAPPTTPFGSAPTTRRGPLGFAEGFLPKRMSGGGGPSGHGAAAGAPPASRMGRTAPQLPATLRQDSWSVLVPASEAVRADLLHRQQQQQLIEEAWARQRLQVWLQDSQLALRSNSITGRPLPHSFSHQGSLQRRGSEVASSFTGAAGADDASSAPRGVGSIARLPSLHRDGSATAAAAGGGGGGLSGTVGHVYAVGSAASLIAGTAGVSSRRRLALQRAVSGRSGGSGRPPPLDTSLMGEGVEGHGGGEGGGAEALDLDALDQMAEHLHFSEGTRQRRMLLRAISRDRTSAPLASPRTAGGAVAAGAAGGATEQDGGVAGATAVLHTILSPRGGRKGSIARRFSMPSQDPDTMDNVRVMLGVAHAAAAATSSAALDAGREEAAATAAAAGAIEAARAANRRGLQRPGEGVIYETEEEGLHGDSGAGLLAAAAARLEDDLLRGRLGDSGYGSSRGSGRGRRGPADECEDGAGTDGDDGPAGPVQLGSQARAGPQARPRTRFGSGGGAEEPVWREPPARARSRSDSNLAVLSRSGRGSPTRGQGRGQLLQDWELRAQAATEPLAAAPRAAESAAPAQGTSSGGGAPSVTAPATSPSTSPSRRPPLPPRPRPLVPPPLFIPSAAGLTPGARPHLHRADSPDADGSLRTFASNAGTDGSFARADSELEGLPDSMPYTFASAATLASTTTTARGFTTPSSVGPFREASINSAATGGPFRDASMNSAATGGLGLNLSSSSRRLATSNSQSRFRGSIPGAFGSFGAGGTSANTSFGRSVSNRGPSFKVRASGSSRRGLGLGLGLPTDEGVYLDSERASSERGSPNSVVLDRMVFAMNRFTWGPPSAVPEDRSMHVPDGLGSTSDDEASPERRRGAAGGGGRREKSGGARGEGEAAETDDGDIFSPAKRTVPGPWEPGASPPRVSPRSRAAAAGAAAAAGLVASLALANGGTSTPVGTALQAQPGPVPGSASGSAMTASLNPFYDADPHALPDDEDDLGMEGEASAGLLQRPLQPGVYGNPLMAKSLRNRARADGSLMGVVLGDGRTSAGSIGGAMETASTEAVVVAAAEPDSGSARLRGVVVVGGSGGGAGEEISTSGGVPPREISGSGAVGDGGLFSKSASARSAATAATDPTPISAGDRAFVGLLDSAAAAAAVKWQATAATTSGGGGGPSSASLAPTGYSSSLFRGTNASQPMQRLAEGTAGDLSVPTGLQLAAAAAHSPFTKSLSGRNDSATSASAGAGGVILGKEPSGRRAQPPTVLGGFAAAELPSQASGAAFEGAAIDATPPVGPVATGRAPTRVTALLGSAGARAGRADRTLSLAQLVDGSGTVSLPDATQPPAASFPVVPAGSEEPLPTVVLASDASDHAPRMLPEMPLFTGPLGDVGALAAAAEAAARSVAAAEAGVAEASGDLDPAASQPVASEVLAPPPLLTRFTVPATLEVPEVPDSPATTQGSRDTPLTAASRLEHLRTATASPASASAGGSPAAKTPRRSTLGGFPAAFGSSTGRGPLPTAGKTATPTSRAALPPSSAKRPPGSSGAGSTPTARASAAAPTSVAFGRRTPSGAGAGPSPRAAVVRRSVAGAGPPSSPSVLAGAHLAPHPPSPNRFTQPHPPTLPPPASPPPRRSSGGGSIGGGTDQAAAAVSPVPGRRSAGGNMPAGGLGGEFPIAPSTNRRSASGDKPAPGGAASAAASAAGRRGGPVAEAAELTFFSRGNSQSSEAYSAFNGSEDLGPPASHASSLASSVLRWPLPPPDVAPATPTARHPTSGADAPTGVAAAAAAGTSGRGSGSGAPLRASHLHPNRFAPAPRARAGDQGGAGRAEGAESPGPEEWNDWGWGTEAEGDDGDDHPSADEAAPSPVGGSDWPAAASASGTEASGAPSGSGGGDSPGASRSGAAMLRGLFMQSLRRVAVARATRNQGQGAVQGQAADQRRPDGGEGSLHAPTASAAARTQSPRTRARARSQPGLDPDAAETEAPTAHAGSRERGRGRLSGPGPVAESFESPPVSPFRLGRLSGGFFGSTAAAPVAGSDLARGSLGSSVDGAAGGAPAPGRLGSMPSAATGPGPSPDGAAGCTAEELAVVRSLRTASATSRGGRPPPRPLHLQVLEANASLHHHGHGPSPVSPRDGSPHSPGPGHSPKGAPSAPSLTHEPPPRGSSPGGPSVAASQSLRGPSMKRSTSSRWHGSRVQSPASGGSAHGSMPRGSTQGASPKGPGSPVWTPRDVAWARDHGPKDAAGMEEALFGPVGMVSFDRRGQPVAPGSARSQRSIKHAGSGVQPTYNSGPLVVMDPEAVTPRGGSAGALPKSSPRAIASPFVTPFLEKSRRRSSTASTPASPEGAGPPRPSLREFGSVGPEDVVLAAAGSDGEEGDEEDAGGSEEGEREREPDLEEGEEGQEEEGEGDGGLAEGEGEGEEGQAEQAKKGAEDEAALEPPPDLAPWLQHDALFCISGDNAARRGATKLILHPWFDNCMLLVILASSAILAVDTPRLNPDSALGQAVWGLDIAFTVIFTVEMLVKWLAKGILLHRHAYWRNGWDILDGFIVATSLLALGLSGGATGALRSIRLVRTLRPLRLIQRWRGMRLVVETLIRSLPTLANVLLFGGFLFGIFGILGVQLFAGKMSICNQTFIDDQLVTQKSQCVEGVTFTCHPDLGDDCDEEGEEAVRWWGPPMRNFDHLGRALLTLFTVATMDGFMEVAWMCIDAVGVDRVPKVNNAPWMGLYIIAFVFLGSFFWVNLLVSVIIDHYATIVAEEGDLLVTKQAKEYMKIFKFERAGKDAFKGGCPEGASKLRQLCWKIASHPHFDAAVLANIVINIVAMAAVYYGSPRAYDVALAMVNVACTVGFALEAAIKIHALGFRKYWKDNWNRLDLFIVIVSIPDIVSTFTDTNAATGIVTVLRLLRVCRMFKLIKNARGLRTLFNTLISSVPAMCNVGSLLLLIMYIYAVIGINMYGGYGSPFDTPDSQANWNNIGTAMLTQFRLFTGDGWGDLMAAAMGCDDNQYQCETGWSAVAAAVFFCSFVIIATFIMLNLVIAVVLDNFIDNAQLEGLLKTSNFVDLLKMVITLRVFVRLMRLKIDALRQADRNRMLTAAAAASRTSRRMRGRNLPALLATAYGSAAAAPSPQGLGTTPGSFNTRFSTEILPRLFRASSKAQGPGASGLLLWPSSVAGSPSLTRGQPSQRIDGIPGLGSGTGAAGVGALGTGTGSGAGSAGSGASAALLATLGSVLPRRHDSGRLKVGEAAANRAGTTPHSDGGSRGTGHASGGVGAGLGTGTGTATATGSEGARTSGANSVVSVVTGRVPSGGVLASGGSGGATSVGAGGTGAGSGSGFKDMREAMLRRRRRASLLTMHQQRASGLVVDSGAATGVPTGTEASAGTQAGGAASSGGAVTSRDTGGGASSGGGATVSPALPVPPVLPQAGSVGSSLGSSTQSVTPPPPTSSRAGFANAVFSRLFGGGGAAPAGPAVGGPGPAVGGPGPEFTGLDSITEASGADGGIESRGNSSSGVHPSRPLLPQTSFHAGSVSRSGGSLRGPDQSGGSFLRRLVGGGSTGGGSGAPSRLGSGPGSPAARHQSAVMTAPTPMHAPSPGVRGGASSGASVASSEEWAAAVAAAGGGHSEAPAAGTVTPRRPSRFGQTGPRLAQSGVGARGPSATEGAQPGRRWGGVRLDSPLPPPPPPPLPPPPPAPPAAAQGVAHRLPPPPAWLAASWEVRGEQSGRGAADMA